MHVVWNPPKLLYAFTFIGSRNIHQYFKWTVDLDIGMPMAELNLLLWPLNFTKSIDHDFFICDIRIVLFHQFSYHLSRTCECHWSKTVLTRPYDYVGFFRTNTKIQRPDVDPNMPLWTYLSLLINLFQEESTPFANIQRLAVFIGAPVVSVLEFLVLRVTRCGLCS